MQTQSIETLKSLALTVRDNKESEAKHRLNSQILKMRQSGSTVTEIADSLGLVEYEVEQSLRSAISQERARLEKTPRAEILMESVSFLRHARDIQMSEASQLDASQFKVGANGEIVKKKLSIDTKTSLALAKSRLIEKAVSCENKAAELLVKTGVLPKQADEIHVSVGDMQNRYPEDEDDIEVERSSDIRNRSEILGDIRSHLMVASRLKNSSIDIPKDAIVLEEDEEQNQEIG